MTIITVMAKKQPFTLIYDPAVGGEQLWRIEPGQAPRLYTEADGWVTVQIEGMGIASQDVTGDGLPEVFLTSQAANRLQTLTGGPSKPTYGDIGLKRGVNVAHPFTGDPLPSTGWWGPSPRSAGPWGTGAGWWPTTSSTSATRPAPSSSCTGP